MVNACHILANNWWLGGTLFRYYKYIQQPATQTIREKIIKANKELGNSLPGSVRDLSIKGVQSWCWHFVTQEHKYEFILKFLKYSICFTFLHLECRNSNAVIGQSVLWQKTKCNTLQLMLIVWFISLKSSRLRLWQKVGEVLFSSSDSVHAHVLQHPWSSSDTPVTNFLDGKYSSV